MKKLSCLLMLCFGLVACDDNKIVGRCQTDNFTVNKIEHDGKIVKNEWNLRLLCHCYKEILQKAPSAEEFLFEIKEGINDDKIVEYKFTNEANNVSANGSKSSAEKFCDAECTKLCNRK